MMKLYSYEQQILLSVWGLIDSFNSLWDIQYNNVLKTSDFRFELHRTIDSMFHELNLRLKEDGADHFYGMKENRNFHYSMYIASLSDNLVSTTKLKISDLKNAEIC